MQKIRVKTKPNAYVVQVGAGLLRRAGREVRRVLPSSGSRVFVITSPNVRRHWGEALEKSLRDARLPYEVLEMHDGEPAKRMHTVEQALAIVDTFLSTPWSQAERHQRRIDILAEYERTHVAPPVPGAPD